MTWSRFLRPPVCSVRCVVSRISGQYRDGDGSRRQWIGVCIVYGPMLESLAKTLLASPSLVLFVQFQDFFGIGMGTYIIGFIGHSLVNYAQSFARKRNLPSALRPLLDRRALVVAYFLCILGGFAVFGACVLKCFMGEGAHSFRCLFGWSFHGSPDPPHPHPRPSVFIYRPPDNS